MMSVPDQGEHLLGSSRQNPQNRSLEEVIDVRDFVSESIQGSVRYLHCLCIASGQISPADTKQVYGRLDPELFQNQVTREQITVP